MTPGTRIGSRPTAAIDQLDRNDSTLVKAFTTKVKIVDFGGLVDGENDDLIGILREWDVDGDGQFSTGELILAAKELYRTRSAKDEAVKKKLLYRRLALLFSVALVILIAVILGVVVVAIRLSQETTVEESDGSGSLMVKGSNSKVVGTASVSDYVSGLSHLFDASAQTLEELSTVNFYHGGDYIQLAVSQVVRGSQRILVYGYPGVFTINQDGTMLWSESGPASSPIRVDDVGPALFQPGRRLESKLGTQDANLLQSRAGRLLKSYARSGYSYRSRTSGYGGGGEDGQPDLVYIVLLILGTCIIAGLIFCIAGVQASEASQAAQASDCGAMISQRTFL